MGNDILKAGRFYQYGIGVEKDEHRAFIYYKKSAEMGNSDGMFALGNCYQYGIGVEKDENNAFIYYQKSANMGNALAMHIVGRCYLYGIGVEKNINMALLYLPKETRNLIKSFVATRRLCCSNGARNKNSELYSTVYASILHSSSK